MTEDREHLSTLVELDAEAEVDKEINIEPNRFRTLCDNVENSLFHIDNSMYEILELKDKLLLQYLPRNVLLQITLVLSRFYRAYSQSQVSIYELIRLVHLYTEPFDLKCGILKTLYESNETKKRMLNFAFQKLTSMENNMKHYEEQKVMNNWEKMYIHRVLPRSNTRKWKFRLTTFREKAGLGYEHVLKWLRIKEQRPSITSELLSNEELTDEQFELTEEKTQLSQTSEITSIIKKPTPIEPPPPPGTKIDMEVQIQPDFNDEQTSTEDILSTKSLIMRIYRPIGMLKRRFQCIIHAQEQKYITNIFHLNIPQKPKEETIQNRRRITKKRDESPRIPDNIDINTIDKEQFSDLLISMPSFFKRRSLFQTDIDPDAIKIDIIGDEKLCGSLIFTSEDLRMLELPDLHSQIILDSDELSINNSFNFDEISNEIYKSWITHTPQTFFIYNDKHEAIGKLPLFMFWYHKIENTHATKSTLTDPIETYESLPKTISSIDVKITDGRSYSNIDTDQIEIVKASYENEISKLHEYYQNEIHRLSNLLNEVISRQTSQTIHSDPSNSNIQQRISKRQSAPVYGRNLPKDFLDRTQMFSQRSLIHRHQLIAKAEQETSAENERRLTIQHRLHKPEQNKDYDDLCLPAVFMPFRSGNVFNPKAHQFFHSIGSTDPRLTQSPSIIKFPSVPSRSVSVLNLFELSQAYEKKPQESN